VRAIRIRNRECSPARWANGNSRSPLYLGYVALLLALRLLFPALAFAQDSEAVEYRVKANFLAAFPKFVEWPDAAFPSANSPIRICVYGHFSFGTSLASRTQATQIHGRPIEVRWARKEQELRGCQILFVSHSEAGRYPAVIRAMRGENVLTVGETPDFLRDGGAIEFRYTDNQLQFAVNLNAASDNHLRISSSMLVMASHVVGPVAVRSTVPPQPN